MSPHDQIKQELDTIISILTGLVLGVAGAIFLAVGIIFIAR